jgi:hypothetical protein
VQGAEFERYAEAVQEFRSRHLEPEDELPEPLPTDEEMASANAALHAWLDEDARRMSALAGDEAWDFGGMRANYFYNGGGIDRCCPGRTRRSPGRDYRGCRRFKPSRGCGKAWWC